jgi:uncharacterized membrane protein
VCPLKGNCSEVVNSNFSKFLGLPVEKLGMIYYLIVAIGFGFRSMWPESTDVLALILLFISTFAVVFSLYLTFIQIFTLRKICTWCLLSALFTLAIFVLSLFGALHSLVPILGSYSELVMLMHVFSMAIGLSAATFTDFFFFKFLKDFRISTQEAAILNSFSQIIWLALGLIVMTGLALYIPNYEVLNSSPKFLVKLIVVFVIVVNGAFLNLFVAPKFFSIKFGLPHSHKKGELLKTRRIAFILGPISIISWYSAFVLGSFKESPASFPVLLGVYILLIGFGIMSGVLTEKHLENRAKK